MAMTTLEDLYIAQLRDIHYAEKQLTKALPKMAKNATNPKLAEELMLHAEETEQHLERLAKVFSLLGLKPRGEKCEAILGHIEEAKELMDECEDDSVRDAAIIMAAQKAEHYEIATYGSLIVFAKNLGLHEQAEILKQIIADEKKADEKLSKLAEAGINTKAKMAA